MIHVEHFRPEHVQLMRIHPQERLDAADAEDFELAAKHEGVSVFIDGELMLCGGIIATKENPALLWSLISADSSRHMLALLRVTERFLSMAMHPVVYATARLEFAQGCRFLQLLKFNSLGTTIAIDDADHLLYARHF